MSAQLALTPSGFVAQSLDRVRAALQPLHELAQDHNAALVELRIRQGLERLKAIHEQATWVAGVLTCLQRDAARNDDGLDDAQRIGRAFAAITLVQGEAQEHLSRLRRARSGDEAHELESISFRLLTRFNDARRALG